MSAALTDARLTALIDMGRIERGPNGNRLVIELDLGHEQSPETTTYDMIYEAIDVVIDNVNGPVPDGALNSRGQP